MPDKTNSPDLIEKVQSTSFTKGCFLLLAAGTLPVLFMSPVSYIFTLAICYIMTRVLNWLLF